jgi:hypothetical protein
MAKEMRRLLLHGRKSESMFLKTALPCATLSWTYTLEIFLLSLTKSKETLPR